MTPVRLVAVGDISFGDNAVCASFGIDSLLRQRPELDLFEHVHAVLRGHDIVFGNLETVLSDDGLNLTSLRSRHMRGRPESVSQLVRAGFNVVNVANNHILQHGRRAFEETVDGLRAHGILPVGVAGRDGFYCEPVRVDVRGMEVVFLGYAFEMDNYHSGVPLYAQTNLAGILADIRQVKNSGNVVVCSFHWGEEFVPYPSREQIAIARGAIDAGCDLILGHHPHVLNGFERYQGGCSFYSLGNFVFDLLWNEDCTRSMAVHLQIAPRDIRFLGADSIRIGRDYRPRVVEDPGFGEWLASVGSQIPDTTRRDRADYAREVGRVATSNRYRSWLYMLTNIHRYDPVILSQIIAEAVMRRVRPAA